MAILWRQSCADIRAGSEESFVRTAFNGAGRHIRRGLDPQFAQLLVQRQLKYTAVRESVGTHRYYVGFSAQSTESISA